MCRMVLLGSLLLLVLVATGCTAPAISTPTTATTPTNVLTPEEPETEPVTVTVFAAASLTTAFTAIADLFNERYPNIILSFNFASSAQLAQQLGAGAPADIFASANNRQMEVAVAAGRISADVAHIFVNNRLVVVYPTNADTPITELAQLAAPGLKIVLAEESVPAGQYALEILAKLSADATYGAGFREDVLANVVSYEENVRVVLTKVALGEADAGIVYFSDTVTEQEVKFLDIPAAFNVIAVYPIAPVNGSDNAEAAQAFIDAVLSAEGQAILQEYGFTPVAP